MDELTPFNYSRAKAGVDQSASSRLTRGQVEVLVGQDVPHKCRDFAPRRRLTRASSKPFDDTTSRASMTGNALGGAVGGRRRQRADARIRCLQCILMAALLQTTSRDFVGSIRGWSTASPCATDVRVSDCGRTTCRVAGTLPRAGRSDRQHLRRFRQDDAPMGARAAGARRGSPSVESA